MAMRRMTVPRAQPARGGDADAVDREEITRSRWIGLELVADVLHVGVDGTLIRFERDSVHRIEKLRAREHSARLAGHRGDELELSRREVDAAVGDRGAHSRYVQRHLSDADDLGL